MNEIAGHSQTAGGFTASLPLLKRFIRQYFRKYTAPMLAAAFFMILSAAMTGGLAKLMEPVIDRVFAAKDATMLWPVALGVLAVFGVRGFATYGHIILLNRVSHGIVADIQKKMFSHLVRADLAFFHNNPSGQLISRVIADTGQIRAAVADCLTGAIKNSFTVMVLIGVMFYQDWALTLWSLLVFPAMILFVARIGRRLRKVFTSMQVETGHLSSLMSQIFQGIRHVKAYGMEAKEEERAGANIDAIFSLTFKAFRVSALMSPVIELTGGLAIVGLIVYGGHQVIAGHATTGQLFSFITAFLLAYDPIKRMARMNTTLQAGLAALDRVFRIEDTKLDIVDRPGARAAALKKPSIALDHVEFSYPDGTQALRGVTLEIPSGRKTALVGRSGSGKSTILNLILRFYDVTAGTLKIDDADIRDITLDSLRAGMALVSQEVVIFDDSARANIAYGKPGATEEEIVAAAKDAAAHDFIMSLPDRYDTRLGEHGLKLSGGQRQRIAIARAFLRNAPILLMDEATSALDADSERQIQAALERLQSGKTTLIIAHRLSTIKSADLIYVMKDGRVAEQGTHDTLLKAGGTYAHFYGETLQSAAEEAAA